MTIRLTLCERDAIYSIYLLTCVSERHAAVANEAMMYVINGEWQVDLPGEYLLNDVIVVYEQTNHSAAELVTLRYTPVDLNVFVSVHRLACKCLKINVYSSAGDRQVKQSIVRNA